MIFAFNVPLHAACFFMDAVKKPRLVCSYGLGLSRQTWICCYGFLLVILSAAKDPSRADPSQRSPKLFNLCLKAARGTSRKIKEMQEDFRKYLGPLGEGNHAGVLRWRSG